MAYEQITHSIDGHVATITLNRPEKLNALTRTMAEEIRHAMFSAGEDDRVRVVVLTGAGRAFCAGSDLTQMAGTTSATRCEKTDEDPEKTVTRIMGIPTEEQRDAGNPFGARSDFRKRFSYIPSIPKPVIAAINGPAAGLGLIVSLYCDFRFASDNARFSIPLVRRGLGAEHGISWLLPRMIGLPNALDLLLSGRTIDAVEALRMGLVNAVFDKDGLRTGVREYAEQLIKLVSPRSLRVIKRQVWEAQFQTLAEAAAAGDVEMISSMESEDFKEGVLHFLEKREPSFSGR